VRTTYPASTGLVTDRAYDRAGRLVDLSSHTASAITARYQIIRDATGNPTTITTTRGTRSQAVAYTYDPADRLTAACIGVTGCGSGQSGKVGYTYDLVGNRLSQTLSGSAGSGTTKYRYDDADQLTEANTVGGATVRYAYDQQGNQIKAGANTFTYNLDHTLASATVNGVRTSYTHDAQGLRLSAVTDSANGPTSKAWTFDVNATLPRLTLETTSTPSGSATRGFLTDPRDTPLALFSSGRADSFAPDWLGGVADVVSPQGETRASYDYDPFGNPRTDGTAGAPSSTVDNPIGFAGGYQDRTLGSRYAYPARVYDPGTGRFAGVDPVSRGQKAPASSGYAYVRDRPTVLVDPSGAIACIRLDDQSGPCASNQTAVQNYTGTAAPPATNPCQYMSPDSCLHWVDPGASQPLETITGNGRKSPKTPNNNPPYHRYSWWEFLLGYVDKGLDILDTYTELRLLACGKGLSLTCKTWGHYLSGDGSDLTVDPSSIDDPNLHDWVNQQQRILLSQAKQKCAGGPGTTCYFNIDSLWHDVFLTKQDYAFGIGQARFRITGTVSITLESDGHATASGSYDLSLYKDWNFDQGKTAELNPRWVPGPLKPIKIDVGQFGLLPSYGLAKEYVLKGTSHYSFSGVVVA
jgi:RHS repeat-associated protein